MNVVLRRLVLVIGLAIVSVACSGGGDSVSAGGPAAPDGDAQGVATCSTARTADKRLGDGATLVAGFTTSVGEFNAWKQTRFPNAPKESVTAEQLASTAPLTVCYFDGSWNAPGPGAGLRFTREIVTVDSAGQANLDLMNYKEKLPVRKPAADAAPLSTEISTGCENGACTN